MFHRLPGERRELIVEQLIAATQDVVSLKAKVDGLKHLGAGVAFSIASEQLRAMREALRRTFSQWLGSQDMRTWQPHVTIQNKVSRAEANALYLHLVESFCPRFIHITGLDLWDYQGGPWRHSTFVPLETSIGNAD